MKTRLELCLICPRVANLGKDHDGVYCCTEHRLIHRQMYSGETLYDFTKRKEKWLLRKKELACQRKVGKV